MVSTARLFIENGFAKDKFAKDYPDFKEWSPPKKNQILEELEENGKIDEYVELEEVETVRDQLQQMPWPKAELRYQVTYETPNLSIEPLYQIILHLLSDTGYGHIEKIRDLFTASEQSSFYGAGAQRIGLAQDKVSQYLAQVGQFIRRDLFQLVRDIRWIQERLTYHEMARKGGDDAEVTLKGLWVDLVDGVFQGQRTAANLFQMATQLQFASLPDFFFSIKPKNKEEVDKLVGELDVNTTLKNTLKRKLLQYMTWREVNYEELKVRKGFELKYLRQHYNILKMYMSWVRPYLRHIERLQSNEGMMDSPHMVTAFEGNLAEIEVLGMNMPEKNKDVFNCLLVTIEYRTRPQMSFQQEGFHRGPIHVGESKITWRMYPWTRDQVDNYKKMRMQEDIGILSQIDSTVAETMDAIGEDLEIFLAEAGEDVGNVKLSQHYKTAKDLYKQYKEQPKKAREKMKEAEVPLDIIDDFVRPKGDLLGPFKDWHNEAKDMFKPFSWEEIKKLFGAEDKPSKATGPEIKGAKFIGRILTFLNYKLFKKANKMPAW
ncbi:hypothetical protein CMO91_03525 [Candidatus Woesearchaeota archaeon]|nr:hypothetical protein [Candidatus Woesearchaeota archaeon]